MVTLPAVLALRLLCVVRGLTVDALAAPLQRVEFEGASQPLLPGERIGAIWASPTAPALFPAVIGQQWLPWLQVVSPSVALFGVERRPVSCCFSTERVTRMPTNVELLGELAELLNHRLPLPIERYFTEDFRLDDAGAGMMLTGHAGAKAMIDHVLALAPDVHYQILDT